MKILVLAGHYKEYLNYILDIPNAKDYRYIPNVEHLRGYSWRDCIVLKIGTYYQREDFFEMEKILEAN